MKAATAPTFGTPLSELNTTPLIDVLLVLLILFVITIPPATNSLEFALPADGPTPKFNLERNSVQIAAGDQILWNGAPVTAAQLGAVLAEISHLPREPELAFEPAPQASYQRAAEVMQIIKLSGVDHFGFVGNERYAEFGKALSIIKSN